ncbi:MAG: hypothetical protein ACUVXG_06265 [Anaerolineae bacterium]
MEPQRKVPRALVAYRQALHSAGVRIIHDPSPEDVRAHSGLIAHPADASIVLAAMQAGADDLVTLDRRHFLDDPGVAERVGLRLSTPGDALAWVRERLSERQVVRAGHPSIKTRCRPCDAPRMPRPCHVFVV